MNKINTKFNFIPLLIPTNIMYLDSRTVISSVCPLISIIYRKYYLKKNFVYFYYFYAYQCLGFKQITHNFINKNIIRYFYSQNVHCTPAIESYNYRQISFEGTSRYNYIYLVFYMLYTKSLFYSTYYLFLESVFSNI